MITLGFTMVVLERCHGVLLALWAEPRTVRFSAYIAFAFFIRSQTF
jgi:hypothetical protein